MTVQDADYEEKTTETPAPAAPASEPRAVEQSKPEAKIERADRPTDALARYAPGSDEWAMQLEPRDMRQANWLAGSLFDSRLFSGFANADGCLAAILLGRSLGLPAMAIVRNCHVIKGKLALHASLITGLVMKSALCEYLHCVETTHERAVYETRRRGAPGPVRLEYTIEDARMAGLAPKNGGGDSAWSKTPRTMLRHRCATELARMVYPDLVAGTYAPEELVDAAEDLPRDARAA